MITVDAALDALFALTNVLPAEVVPLAQADGRVLAKDVTAQRDQPPFAASAMDGYATMIGQVTAGATFTVIGEASAGHGFAGTLKAGEAIRIFTGAPLPSGANHVLIQEDVTRHADQIVLNEGYDPKPYVRPAGADFRQGDKISAPKRLRPADIALLAAMNIPQVPVTRRPDVAIIATGDELVHPGETPSPDQIIASNSYGLAALLREAGATPRLLPIARDNETSLMQAFDLAADADLILTIGGASVGDHDLVGKVAAASGLKRAFYKIAMRPGKPLMAGRMGQAMMIGLPGNPVSAMVCGHIFVVPVIRAMLGLGCQAATRRIAPLAHDITANGPREHYTRAHLADGQVTISDRQDSALLSVLADANCLAIRPMQDGPRKRGDVIEIIPL